jgi:hypothetical protein
MGCRRMPYSKGEGADYLIHVGESNSRRESTLMQSHQVKDFCLQNRPPQGGGSCQWTKFECKKQLEIGRRDVKKHVRQLREGGKE